MIFQMGQPDINPSVPERLLDFPALEEKLSKLYIY